jgi:hypothetical protein
MPQRTNQAKPAAPSVEPKPELVTNATPHETERAKRLEAYRIEAQQLRTLRRFDKLERYFDPTCVLALADLFAYGGHSEGSMDDTPNWLGRFLSEVLLEVAANGPEWANAHPEFVKLEFDKAIEELRAALLFCREIESKMPASVVLEEIEKWPAPAEQ